MFLDISFEKLQFDRFGAHKFHTNKDNTHIYKKSKISNTNLSLVPHFWAYKKLYEELENGHHKLFNDTSFLLNRDLKGQNVSLHQEWTYDFKLGGRSIRKEKKKKNLIGIHIILTNYQQR